MTGAVGAGTPVRRLTARAVAAGVIVLLIGAVPACGARDGEATETLPAPPTSTAGAPTTTTRPVERFRGFSDQTYAWGGNWLCGPRAAIADRCLESNQDTTVVDPGGRTQIRASDPGSAPPFDCFYVYPPFGFDGEIDTAMSRDTATEEDLVFAQAARLREQCRVYAPLFRQTGVTGDAAVPYGDVRTAFKHYMGQWNNGRRMVLFGDAQGADHLTRLLQDEFDEDAELRALLISAFLIGGHVDTAVGSRTGGTFRNIASCASAADTGCVVGFSATSASTPRDVAARWGEAPVGRTRLCVNPASPGGGPGPLTPIIPAGLSPVPVLDVRTPFVELPGVVTAECVTTGQTTTLVVRPTTTDAAADIRRPDALVASMPVWGLHLSEVSLTLGSIMEMLAQQSAKHP